MVIYKVTSYKISKLKSANRCDKPNVTWVRSLEGWKQVASTLFIQAPNIPVLPACPLGELQALGLTQYASELMAELKAHVIKLPCQVIQRGNYKNTL